MVFNSLAYIFLVLFSRAGEIFTRFPAIILLLGSAVFYFIAGPFDCLIFVISLITNWLIVKLLSGKKTRIAIAAFFNIGLLFFFKYAEFFLSFQDSDTTSSSYINIALPLGISFYTFQILSYHIDVARKQTPEASKFSHFALFVSFFPQLVAGPIVRSHQLLPQIERLFQGKRRKLYLISFGIGLIVLGLFKKVILADNIAPHVDEIFILGPENIIWAWLGAILFGFQIYFDFSGYSDIAIGSAFLLGIRLPWNFHTPYLSAGPREFWQRWHITLSTWIKDYLYIPLGGNHGGLIRGAIVITATMAIAGLWHGADFTFLIWGFLWGLYIYSGRLVGSLPIPKILSIAGHFIITTALWVLFRAVNTGQALSYYAVMFGLKHGEKSPATFYEETNMLFVLSFFAALLMAFHILEDKLLSKETFYKLKRLQGPFMYGFLIMLGFAILMLQTETINPFIYFRF